MLSLIVSYLQPLLEVDSNETLLAATFGLPLIASHKN
jgi:hypothetical protein